MRIVSWLLTLLIIIFGIFFTVLNAKSVEVNYIIGTKILPLAVLLLIVLTIGVLLSILILGIKIISLKVKNKSLESKLKKSQDELLKMK